MRTDDDDDVYYYIRWRLELERTGAVGIVQEPARFARERWVNRIEVP